MQNKKTQLKIELKQYRIEYKDVLAALESPYLSVREIEHLDAAIDRIGENIDLLEALVQG